MTVSKLKHAVSKAFHSRNEEEKLESNIGLSELVVLITQVDRSGGLCVGRFKRKVRASAFLFLQFVLSGPVRFSSYF